MSRKLKYAITDALLIELNKIGLMTNVSADSVMHKWWWTGRQDGLRITSDALINVFTVLDIEHFTFKITRLTNIQRFLKHVNTYSKFGETFPEIQLSHLSKKLKCPYYIDNCQSSIILFDSKIAMMVALYGSINEYLETL